MLDVVRLSVPGGRVLVLGSVGDNFGGRCGTVWDTSMLKVLLAGLRHERRDHLDLGPVPDLREPILTAGAAACLAFQTVQRMK